MALSIRNPGTIVSFTSASAVYDGALVIASAATDLDVIFPAGAQGTGPYVGLVYAPGAYGPTGTAVVQTATEIAAGKAIDVVVSGIYPGVSAGVVTRGNEVTSGGADGTVQAVTALGAGTNAGVIGIALASAVAADIFPILLTRYVKQG